MFNLRLAFTGLLAALPLLAAAQTYTEDTTFDFRARAGVSADWKVAGGLHLSAGEEIRLKDNLSSFGKSVTDIGLSYKFGKHFKIGADYTFIYGKDDLRHRADVFATGILKAGRWKFSLREKLVLTHKTGEFNVYQQPVNALDLRSRIKASYDIRHSPLEPYAFCELRNTLNAVKYSGTTASSMTYSDVYVNRVRTGLGLEWKLSNTGSLDFYGLFDYCYRKKYDAYGPDAKKHDYGDLKSLTISPALQLTLGLAYNFRF